MSRRRPKRTETRSDSQIAKIPLRTGRRSNVAGYGPNWPVVQRDKEYTTIQSALVDQQGVCGIVLVGDAGVGKPTLARLVRQALPVRVQWVAGTESARSIPLGVFAHLAGSATSRDPVTFLAAARETILSEGHSVEGHLYRACINLDISDREDLASMIRPGATA